MKKLKRSEKDTVFGGVCGGIAEYFEVDSTFVRIGTIVLAMVTFPTFIIGYIAACLIIPKKSGKMLIKELKEGIEEGIENE